MCARQTADGCVNFYIEILMIIVQLNGARFQRKPPKLPVFDKQCKRLLVETLQSCTVHVLAQNI